MTGRAAWAFAWVVSAFLLGTVGCGVEERSDFLVGRVCDPSSDECDPGQVCLPHSIDLGDGALGDFLCRDRVIQGEPIPYCGTFPGYEHFACPEGFDCMIDKIRTGNDPRLMVCHPK